MISEMMLNPPRYTDPGIADDDGRPIVQTWRRMPQLAQILQALKDLLEKRSREFRESHEFMRDPACAKCNPLGYLRFRQTGKGLELLPPDAPNDPRHKIRQCDCWKYFPKSKALQLAPPEEERKTLRDVLKSAVERSPSDTDLQKIADEAVKLSRQFEKAHAFPESPYSTYSPSDTELEQKKRQARELAAKMQKEAL